jgi:erythritol transport system ATP-binding protein
MPALPSILDAETTVQDHVILSAEHITHVYPGTVALDDVSFHVRKGKVNVLIGENGAGKSTLMKILAGVQRPTSGRILLDGAEIQPRSPLEATRLGIGMIFQELNLCDNLSVVDNIFLAREMTRRNGLIARKSQKERASELLRKLEQKIDRMSFWATCVLGSNRLWRSPRRWPKTCAS